MALLLFIFALLIARKYWANGTPMGQHPPLALKNCTKSTPLGASVFFTR
jgi:hypothetical protein